VLRSEEQAEFSFAEWWVLAQAQWLVMLYPSAYTITAAEVGFGTSGLGQHLRCFLRRWPLRRCRATFRLPPPSHTWFRRHAEVRLRAQHILTIAV
jgi:hypothetical protein